MAEKFENWYDKNYKKILIVPAVILALSLIYIVFFYVQTGDIINRDVSLTGGTTITVFTAISSEDLDSFLSQHLEDFSTRTLSDNSGQQTQIVITSSADRETLVSLLEEFLKFELDDSNSTIEFTESSLSGEFYKQLIVAVLLAFFWMAGVVFVIFAKGKKIKFYSIVLNILLGFFMGFFFLTLNPFLSGIIFIAFATLLIYIYIKNSVPSFAVMLSAFADIVMTLALVNLLGMKISTAGIVAFLMLIGYSVDTDILLTTRLLKKHEATNKSLWNAFKTGTTMTLTSIIAIATALIVVWPFETILNQVFIILLIGLGFDLLNTWLTNAGIIKWYVDTKQ